MMKKLSSCHEFVSTFLLNKMLRIVAVAHNDQCEMYVKLMSLP